MAETVSAIVSEIISQGSFDLSSTEILPILNRRHKLMVARARTYRKTASAGPTVANQQEYNAPTDLLVALEIDVDGTPYKRARRTDKWADTQSLLSVTWPGTVFYETASSAGVDKFGLIPAPSTAGLTIDVYGAYRPPDLLIDNSVPFQVDDDAIEGLMAGVFATLLSRPSEARPDLAATQEQTFTAACEELRLREKRRLRGGGPAQIRLQELYY